LTLEAGCVDSGGGGSDCRVDSGAVRGGGDGGGGDGSGGGRGGDLRHGGGRRAQLLRPRSKTHLLGHGRKPVASLYTRPRPCLSLMGVTAKAWCLLKPTQVDFGIRATPPPILGDFGRVESGHFAHKTNYFLG
jgi:hypothetical protein